MTTILTFRASHNEEVPFKALGIPPCRQSVYNPNKCEARLNDVLNEQAAN